jgi:hypothetical protein
MEVKIKDAARIEQAINGEIEYLSSRLSNLNNTNSNSKIEAENLGNSTVATTLEQIGMLRNVKFNIRAKKAEFNEASGINKLTALIAISVEQRDELENLVLASIGPASEYPGFRDTPTRYSVGLSMEEFDNYRATLKSITREITRLKDKCTGKNANGTITLLDSDVHTLRKFSLID